MLVRAVLEGRNQLPILYGLKDLLIVLRKNGTDMSKFSVQVDKGPSI